MSVQAATFREPELTRASPLELAMNAAVVRALESADITGLVAIMPADPLTTARYLRAVNSPFYAPRQPTSSAAAALQLLGAHACAMIAQVSSSDYTASRRHDDSLERMRVHCVQTAVLARSLSADRSWADEAYVAGLLHEIQFMLRATSESQTATPGGGTDDTSRSAALLSGWNLPVGIVHAVEEHERALQTGLVPDSEMGRVLWLAHSLAHCVCPETLGGPLDLAWFAAQIGMEVEDLEHAILASQEWFRAVERYSV